MGEFTINGTQNLNVIQPADAMSYKSVYTLADSQVSVIGSDYANCIFQQWKSPTSDLWLSQYQMQENATLYGGADEPVLELQFILDEGMEHQIEGLGVIVAPKASFNLYYEPYVENTVFLKKGSRIITFDVHLHVAELQLFCPYLPMLDPFLKKIACGKFALLKKKAHPATSDLMFLVNSILHAPSRPGIQAMILQPQIDALVLQSLCYLTESKIEPLAATTHERKAIEDVRTYLLLNVDNDLTIPELSKKFAINEYKLKALFREQNGVPLLGFTIRERMSKACYLLKHTKTPISEIGYMIGYQTPSSFSEKFKELFLISPLKYRKF